MNPAFVKHGPPVGAFSRGPAKPLVLACLMGVELDRLVEVQQGSCKLLSPAHPAEGAMLLHKLTQGFVFMRCSNVFFSARLVTRQTESKLRRRTGSFIGA